MGTCIIFADTACYSGVLAESLVRSRHKWIQEGLFEKYWTKPHKRKGVVNEDPKNPPKDSMAKVGTVTITIEPHIVEATMYVVKDPKSREKAQVQKPQPQPQHQSRPIIQYGPPNGSMPPPQTPASSTASPAPPEPTASQARAASPALTQGQQPRAPSNGPEKKMPVNSTPFAPPPTVPAASPSPAQNHPPIPPAISASAAQTPPPPIPAPSASAPSASAPSASAPSAGPRPPSNPPPGHTVSPAPGSGPAPAAIAGAPLNRPAPVNPTTTPSPGPSRPPTAVPGASPAPVAKPTTNDPVIALLAQRASGDAELRDLMKRVAVGQAKQHELNHFQSIINQLSAEYKRSGGQQGPSADRLLVDGRTVKYFADEVCAILDIVLASNPNQRAADLRPPPRSDPLVVLVVKTALEDQRTKDMCRRISTGKPGFTDATDLKEILDRLHRDSRITPPSAVGASQARHATPASAPNRPTNGHLQAPGGAGASHPNPQALRSKGPPPVSKPDISAVVFDFGTGDRYLFPKFSILEYLPTNSGQQVVASFLIVRKGSMSEYGGDPALDYYQPVTMRLYTHTGRHLENLARVVAPQDEVRRYMDDVMDNMTRAEYILLAMRLPRGPKDEGDSTGGKDADESKTSRSTPNVEKGTELPAPVSKPSVLWTTTNAAPQKPTDLSRAIRSREAEEETRAQYLRLINSVAAKEPTSL